MRSNNPNFTRNVDGGFDAIRRASCGVRADVIGYLRVRHPAFHGALYRGAEATLREVADGSGTFSSTEFDDLLYGIGEAPHNFVGDDAGYATIQAIETCLRFDADHVNAVVAMARKAGVESEYLAASIRRYLNPKFWLHSGESL